jgi:ABC-2 type transport system permease protein
MAVYKRGYQRYQGPLANRWARLMVLPRFSWQRLFQQRLIVLLMVVALIWPLLCACFIYLSNNVELLAGFGPVFKNFIKVDGKFFMSFMSTQAFFAVILAALIGPGLIAPDLANNALPLYFSRPLSRTAYSLARLGTLFGVLSFVTWIPGLLLFAIQAGMAEKPWFSENWKIGAGIFAGLALWILLLSLVALAGSAYARMKAVAGGIVLGFFFILSGMATIINGIFRSTWGHILSPTWTTERLWYAMLNLDPPEGPGVMACVSILAIMIILLAFILERKLRPVEVIS